MTDFDQDDVVAMRQQGDWREFMRQQIAEGAARRDAKPKPSAPPPLPGHAPGAWPTGTSPPGPPPPQPAAAWREALDVHRAWLAETDRPEADSRRYRCECGACELLATSPEGASDDPRA
jgi:hypothetical protein